MRRLLILSQSLDMNPNLLHFNIRNLYDTLAKNNIKKPIVHTLNVYGEDCNFLLESVRMSVSTGKPIKKKFTQEYKTKIDGTPSEPTYLKKKRTVIPQISRIYLENFFKVNPTPDRNERIMISEKTNLTYDQVRIWFNNKRMRSKGFNFVLHSIKPGSSLRD
ncbi:MATa1 protein [[Candida] anglica]